MTVKRQLLPIIRKLLPIVSSEQNTLNLPQLKFEAENVAGAALTVYVIGIPETVESYSNFQFGIKNDQYAGTAPMSPFELADDIKKNSDNGEAPKVINVNSWLLQQVKVLLPELKDTLGGQGVNCKHVSFHGYGLCGAVAAVLGIYYSVVYNPNCMVSTVSLNSPRFTDKAGQELIWKTKNFYYFGVVEDYASPGNDVRRVQILVSGETRYADVRSMFPPQELYKCTGRIWLFGEPSPGQPRRVVPVAHSHSDMCSDQNQTNIRDISFQLNLEEARRG